MHILKLKIKWGPHKTFVFRCNLSGYVAELVPFVWRAIVMLTNFGTRRFPVVAIVRVLVFKKDRKQIGKFYLQPDSGICVRKCEHL